MNYDAVFIGFYYDMAVCDVIALVVIVVGLNSNKGFTVVRSFLRVLYKGQEAVPTGRGGAIWFMI